MSRQFPVKGLKQLDAYLSHFPMNMQKNALRGALRAAAKPIRDEARLRAPKKTGAMAKSIKTSSPRQMPDGRFRVTVTLKGPHAFLGLFHEYGVRPHYITAEGQALSARKLTQKARRDGDPDTLKINGEYVSGAVFHPGHIARPFMRPALDVKADDAVNAFAVKIQDYIEKQTGFTAPIDEAA